MIAPTAFEHSFSDRQLLSARIRATDAPKHARGMPEYKPRLPKSSSNAGDRCPEACPRHAQMQAEAPKSSSNVGDRCPEACPRHARMQATAAQKQLKCPRPAPQSMPEACSNANPMPPEDCPKNVRRLPKTARMPTLDAPKHARGRLIHSAGGLDEARRLARRGTESILAGSMLARILRDPLPLARFLLRAAGLLGFPGVLQCSRSTQCILQNSGGGEPFSDDHVENGIMFDAILRKALAWCGLCFGRSRCSSFPGVLRCFISTRCVLRNGRGGEQFLRREKISKKHWLGTILSFSDFGLHDFPRCFKRF